MLRLIAHPRRFAPLLLLLALGTLPVLAGCGESADTTTQTGGQAVTPEGAAQANDAMENFMNNQGKAQEKPQ